MRCGYLSTLREIKKKKKGGYLLWLNTAVCVLGLGEGLQCYSRPNGAERCENMQTCTRVLNSANTDAYWANPYKWCQKSGLTPQHRVMPPKPAKNDAGQEVPENGVGSSVDPEATSAAKPGTGLEELAEMVKTLVRTQKTRDQQMERGASRQEQRWKRVQHQLQQLQLQVNDMGEGPGREQHQEEEDEYEESDGEAGRGRGATVHREPPPHREPRLLSLSPEDDIEHFLTTFERIALICRWHRDEWAIRLVPLLTGKARSAYVLMDINDSDNYTKVKEAVLSKYEIMADTYRRRFRSLNIEPGETPRELYERLKYLFGKWVKPDSSTGKDIAETLILEQFLMMVHPDLEVWIREHDPKTAEQAARLAEVFTSARKESSFGRENHNAQSSTKGDEQGSGLGRGSSGMVFSKCISYSDFERLISNFPALSTFPFECCPSHRCNSSHSPRASPLIGLLAGVAALWWAISGVTSW